MSRLANLVMSRDFYQKIAETPQGSFLALCGALVFAIAVLWTKIFMVVAAGMAGTALSFWLHQLQKSDNPYRDLKPIWGLRRTTVITFTSIFTAILALVFFLKGITLPENQSVFAAFCTASAYACFAFSVSSFVFGHQRVSSAKRRLAQAGVEQTHAWRVEADRPHESTFLRNVLQKVTD
ncbi:hypothetical protein KX928_00495 [Roseobacter sp. YSTF-M11]|uniref:Uncharacterized protein n=1 Tax=Roseobacter insulae TaxID=2859783 RepID=A0A9X1K095_9RHOB|nr:hypothetical protein [Roseobacter insulae]MBW4706258.1 hypothetical protein [Roseobacter insulae]